MAARAIQASRASPLPLDLIAQAIPMLTRHELAAMTERLIDYLDRQDGDNDIEPNGDELDGSAGEDDFCAHSYGWRGEPGCPVSDPDAAVDDSGCDDINDDREAINTILTFPR